MSEPRMAAALLIERVNEMATTVESMRRLILSEWAEDRDMTLREIVIRWRRPPPVPDELVGYIPALRDFPCATCGRPSVGWRFAVEDDAIEGVAVCQDHMKEAA